MESIGHRSREDSGLFHILIGRVGNIPTYRHQIKHLRKITPRPTGLLWPHLTTFKSETHKD